MLPTSLGRLRLLASHIPRSASPASLAPPLARRPMSTAPTFPRSPVPKRNGEHVVRNAGCLIIGDEVLNGKTRDSNSNYLAKMLFDLGVELKRIEVIADDEDEIAEAVLRMHKNYDLVITSGGIGPTHDDITYSSIAKAFGQGLEYHEETKHRMEEMGKHRYNMNEQTEEQKTARLRMALFPKGAEVLFVQEDLWVPVVRVGGKVCIFPGVPRLFERLVEGFVANYVTLPPSSEKPFRVLVHTELPESSIAPFLTTLQERVKKELVRVGSYPKFLGGVDVSLIGKEEPRLHELAQEVVKELKGELVASGKLGQEEPVK
ncbi:MoaB/Mog domain-containing protein [Rhodotorula diobovata]|uniref:MoaB/Mog domain-containing protein n=1 Tax=Rhodotorula diobovata TaxID=5288 RepID=A0A5C5FR56_9BASI|nr:MoaB/Mog domain-containing protein [Rhodotorula diobovata]